MDDNWQFYFFHRSGKIATASYNAAIEAIAPDKSRPWLVGVRIKMKTPNAGGLSTPAEGMTFIQIQSRLNSSLLKELKATPVGMIATGGWWELYYYAPHTTGFPVFLEKALGEYKSYERMTFAKEDKDWMMYRSSLAPSPEKKNQQILNREVILNLKNLGWDLKTRLRVDHVLVFPTAEKRNEAIAMVKREGYEISDQFETEPANSPGFGLQISRNDMPEEHSMQAIIFHLIDLAASLGGKYDGWGAKLAR